MAIWKLTKKPKPKLCHINDETGKVLTESNDILDRCIRCYKDLSATNKQAHTEWPNIENSCCQEPEIMGGKIKKAIRKLQNDKSMGYDNIPAEDRCEYCMNAPNNMQYHLEESTLAYWMKEVAIT